MKTDEDRKWTGAGSRVVRGRDWRDGNRDGGEEGTVTGLDYGVMNVRWDNGNERKYDSELYGDYQVKLAK